MNIQTLTSKMSRTPEFSTMSMEQLESIGNAVLNGKMIDAIGLYRNYTGTGLADAKAAVDRCFALAAETTEEPVPNTGCENTVATPDANPTADIGNPSPSPADNASNTQPRPAPETPTPTNDPGTAATGAPAANGVTVSKNTITSLLSIIIVGVILFFSFNSCDGFLGGEEADGKNIKVIYVDENSVGFYPVCPKCGHVGDAYDVKLSPGEDFETYFPCENRQCQHLYEVTVERDD